MLFLPYKTNLRGDITKTHNINPIDIDSYIIKEGNNSLNKNAIEEELNKIAQKNFSLCPVKEIKEGDIASFSLASQNKKFNKNNLKVVVGKNNFDEEFEKTVLGLKINEQKQIEIDDSVVEVTVISVLRKKVPQINDELIVKENIPNVTTVQEYKAHSLAQQKDQRVIDVTNAVLSEIIKANEFYVQQDEIECLVERAFESCRVQAKEEGKDFESMTREELATRVAAYTLEQFRRNCTVYYENYLKIAVITALALKIPLNEIDISEKNFNALWTKFKSYVKQKLYGDIQ